MKTSLKNLIKKFFNSFGYEIKKINITVDEKAGGFPSYLEESQKLGMDVNDWQEQTQGWPKALPILEQTVFPYLKENAVVCELGPGTGRQARHFAKKETVNQQYLIDNSPWLVDFLKEYFKANQKVHVYLNNGYSLPFSDNSFIDLIFSGGCFIAFKLSTFKCYCSEFFRVLKPGGYCIINYIDIDTQQGWNHFKTYGSDYGGDCYDYHSEKVIDRVFSSEGFEIVARYHIDHFSTYLVLRKL